MPSAAKRPGAFVSLAYSYTAGQRPITLLYSIAHLNAAAHKRPSIRENTGWAKKNRTIFKST